ncbi:MAG: cell division protein ZipA, partial [Polynucleobacter victoriensis]
MIGFAEFAASLGLTELQLSLGLIGFSLLVLVMIYNAMRIRKVEVEDASNSVDEGLTAEPSFSSIDGVLGRSEPTLGATDAPTAAQVAAVPKIDPLIDCVVALRLPESISGEEILGHLTDWPKNTLFTWMCEGLNSASDWESVISTGSYTELQVAIQLANRTG